MRGRRRKILKVHERPTDWERWYAWWPVTATADPETPILLGGKPVKIWLQWAERRWVPPYAHDNGYYEYRKV